jgi:hypothetical protein
MWGIYLIHGYGLTQLCTRASVTKCPPADVWRELYNQVKNAYFASCKIVLKCQNVRLLYNIILWCYWLNAYITLVRKVGEVK